MLFKDTEKSLSEHDIKLIEQDLQVQLPEQLKSHYLIFNGGTPEKSLWIDSKGKWDDIEVRDFIPFLYCEEFGDDQTFTANGIAREQWQLNELPNSLLPFAMDWGGNYICINLKSFEIYYFVRDVWSENLTIEKNLQVNSNLISKSFSSFMSELTLTTSD